MAEALYLSKLNVNGQEYQIKDANAATTANLEQLEADFADSLATKVGYGEYDSETGNIVFKEGVDSTTELFSIDATDFIKDGMVSNVEVSEGNLVITFNTDAGKEPISIALTDIFNPANYYNKTEVDGKLDLKADASNVYTKSEADGKFLTEHQSLADYPTIETMNTALGQKANVSDIYTQTEIDNKLAAKADASNVYTKSEVDEQSETTAQALSNINTQLAAKANSADLATVATSGSYNDLSDKPVIPEGAVVDAALSDTSENPVQNKVVKGALDSKADASALTEVRQDVDKKADVCYVDFEQLTGSGFVVDSELYNSWIEAKENNAIFYTSNTVAVDGLRSEPLRVLSGPEGEFIRFYMYNDYGWKSAEIVQTGETEFQVTTDSWTYETDDQLDSESTNPVQNAVITQALDAKADASSVYTKSQADARWPYNTYVSVDGETLVITSSQLK